jgi:SAM-dependent methyltransferase
VIGPIGPGQVDVLRNGDVDWHRWPVACYLEENYRDLHPADAAVIDHHSAYYRRLPPDSLVRSLEFGAGPNLYPLMLAAACSREIHALDPSTANVTYLNRQLADGPDQHWGPFYARCRRRNRALPAESSQALERVQVIQGNGLSVPPGSYDLASMHFVAEGASEVHADFVTFCLAFIRSVRPGGHLVAAFMENLGRYQVGEGPHWPGYRVDPEIVRDAFRAPTGEWF